MSNQSNTQPQEKTVKTFSIKTWKKMFPFLKPYSKRFVWLFFLMLVLAAIDVAIPLFLSYAINTFIEAKTIVGIPTFAAVYIVALLLQAVCVAGMGRVSMGTEMRLSRDLKRKLYIHLQRLGFSYYNQHAVGWILSRVMSDTNSISGTVAWWLIDIIWGSFYIIGVFIAMLILNWQLALIVFAVVPITAILTSVLQGNIIEANRTERQLNSRIVGSFNEGITGAKTSKTLVIEDRNLHDFKELTGEMRSAAVRTTRLNTTLIPIAVTLSSVAVAMVLARGGAMEMDKILMTGTLSAFISYALLMMEPVQQVVRAVVAFIGVQVNIERMNTLLETSCDITDTPEAIERDGDIFSPKNGQWQKIKGEIEFENVWFKYPDGEEYILEDFSLKIPAGTTVAIVGETGAGKSTLINLACRFYEPTKGRVLIDGENVRNHSQIWLQSQLGYVLQNPHLFSGSIKENIRYGRLNATDEEIITAAKLVSADVVADKMEDGYNTDVGEGGDRLSTGEKQLISFARAMLANPPIFVLDEATSSIDTETEQLIQESISHILQGRTSFLVAHRLSTIKHADIILVVKEGKIIERGSHKELMKAKGYYHKLYTAMRIDEAQV